MASALDRLRSCQFAVFVEGLIGDGVAWLCITCFTDCG